MARGAQAQQSKAKGCPPLPRLTSRPPHTRAHTTPACPPHRLHGWSVGRAAPTHIPGGCRAKKKQALKDASADHSQLAARTKAMKFVCVACKLQLADVNQYKSHWSSKHAKLPKPPELE